MLTYEEIKLPMPWGFVAGKSWRSGNEDLIVALHGFQDNANSFDKIIPYLPKTYHYLCFDLPGHGKSSPFETKSIPSIFDFVLTLKIILNHLNRRKYILLGHSFGAQVSILYTQLYPAQIEKLICLDAVHFNVRESEMIVPQLKTVFKRYLKLSNLTEVTAPSYTYEIALQKMKDARIVNMSDEVVKVLIDRSVKPTEDGKYKFTNSQQLKYLYKTPLSIKIATDLVINYPVKCPHLIIKATNTAVYYEIMKNVHNAYEETNKAFESYFVDGSHDVHIENPELVAKFVNKFLLKHKSKL